MNITEHAFDRAKERLGWKRRTLYRMMPRILIFGERMGNVIKYGEATFVFRDKELITVLNNHNFIANETEWKEYFNENH